MERNSSETVAKRGVGSQEAQVVVFFLEYIQRKKKQVECLELAKRLNFMM